jgi:hypothetical protein
MIKIADLPAILSGMATMGDMLANGHQALPAGRGSLRQTDLIRGRRTRSPSGVTFLRHNVGQFAQDVINVRFN